MVTPRGLVTSHSTGNHVTRLTQVTQQIPEKKKWTKDEKKELLRLINEDGIWSYIQLSRVSFNLRTAIYYFGTNPPAELGR